MQQTTKDEQMRKLIIEAAQKLFQQYGLSKTTMEDIAKFVGKGKSSLYYYYATKEQIFEAVVEKEKEGIEREIIAAVNKEATTLGKFRALALAKYKEIRKRRITYQLETTSELPEKICLYNIIRQRYDEAEQAIVKSILQYGLQEGEISCDFQYDLPLLASVCGNTLRGLQVELSFLGNYKGSAVSLINTTVEILMKGMKS